MSPLIWSHLILLLVAVFYGLNYFIAKIVFEELSPFALIAIRGIAGVLFFTVMGSLIGRQAIQRKDLLMFGLAGMMGVGINQIFFLWGLSKTVEVNASVLMTMVPVCVLLIAWLMKQEHLGRKKVVGIALSFSGALLLSLNGRSMQIGTDTLLGDAMVLFNTCCYATYLVLIRPLSQRYNPFTVIMGIFWFGSWLTIPVGIPALIATDWASLSLSTWGGIAFVVVCITWAAYGLHAWALKHVPASQVGVYVYLQPVIVALLAPFLAETGISFFQLFCMSLVLVGVYLVSRKPRPILKRA